MGRGGDGDDDVLVPLMIRVGIGEAAYVDAARRADLPGAYE
jgi:hypothetical protein